MGGKGYYLDNKPYQEARRIFLNLLEEKGFLKPLKGIELATEDCAGRITSEPVYAAISSPHYRAAAMDGIAVSSTDTLTASESNPKLLREGELAVRVNTGEPLPEGRDAVIMLEDVAEVEDGFKIFSPVPPGQNVRPVGEDFRCGEMLYPVNHRLSALDIGVIIGSGNPRIRVRRRVAVGIITTGSELVSPYEKPAAGQIIDSNGPMLSALFREWECETTFFPRVPDAKTKIEAAVKRALEVSDIVLVNAGSSAGERDHVVEVIKSLGDVVVHGVNTKPGRPVILGICGGKPVIGLPGYPVSTVMACDLFVKPIVDRLYGQPARERRILRAKLAQKVYSAFGKEEFLRVACAPFAGEYKAVPLGRGAAKQLSLAKSSGYIRIPADVEGLHAGTEVEVELTCSKEQVDRNVIVAGQILPALEGLQNLLALNGYPLDLITINTDGKTAMWMLNNRSVHFAAVCQGISGDMGEMLYPGEDDFQVNLASIGMGFAAGRGESAGENLAAEYNLFFLSCYLKEKNIELLLGIIGSERCRDMLSSYPDCGTGKTGENIQRKGMDV